MNDWKNKIIRILNKARGILFIRGFQHSFNIMFLGQCLKTNHNVSWQYLEILKTNHNVSWIYLKILKTNQRSITIFSITNQYKTVWNFLKHSALQRKTKEHARCYNGQKTTKNCFSCFGSCQTRFPETQEFIDSTLKEECEKERMTADEVIFYKFKSKKLAWINILVLDLVL